MEQKEENVMQFPNPASGTEYSDRVLGDGGRRYALLFEKSLAGVFLATLEGRLIDCNRSFAEMLGYASCEEARTLPLAEFFWPEYGYEHFIQRVRSAGSLRGGSVRMRRKEGSPAWVLANVTLLGEEFLCGTLIDASAARMTAGLQAESEERLRLLIESTDNVVLMLDLGGRILYANPSSRYGIPGQDLVGKTLYEFFSRAEADRMMERLAHVARSGKPLSVEDSIVWQGELIWFHVQYYPVLNGKGEVGNVTLMAHEVSDVKKAEMALRQAQERLSNERLRMRIAADLHDEIGSVLSSVSIFAGLARQAAGKESPQVDTLLSRVEENVQYVMNSLDDIIWAINPDNDTLDDIILRIRTHATEVLEARGIRLNFSLEGKPEGQVVPLGKRRDFYLIFREALNNLVRHSGASDAEISVSLHDSVLTLVLRDNGCGFDLRRSSMGNGLNNMRKRAAALGGRIDVESTPGQGSRIVLTFETT